MTETSSRCAWVSDVYINGRRYVPEVQDCETCRYWRHPPEASTMVTQGDCLAPGREGWVTDPQHSCPQWELRPKIEPVCGNCRHWKAHSVFPSVVGGRCLWARTEPQGEQHWDRPQAVGPYAYGMAINGGGELLTPSTFGCNQFEAKGSA